MAHESMVEAMKALKKSTEIFRQKVSVPAPCPILTGKRGDKRWKPPVPNSLADDRSRMAAGRALIECLSGALDWDDAPPWRRWYLVTICTDKGRIDLDTVDPISLKGLIHKTYKALADLGLHGVGVVEPAPFRKSKLHGKMIYAHPHCVVWTDDQDFKPNNAAELLMESKRFPNSLGLTSVTIISRKKAASLFKGSDYQRDLLFADLKRDQTSNSMAWLGYYLWQAPSYVKHAYKPKNGKRDVQLRTGTKHYSPQFAVAVQNLLNCIPTIATVFGIGDGKRIRAEWKKKYIKEIGGRSVAEVTKKAAVKRRKAKKAKGKAGHRRAIRARRLESEMNF